MLDQGFQVGQLLELCIERDALSLSSQRAHGDLLQHARVVAFASVDQKAADLGAALIAAALEEVDATPMEAFDPAAVDQLLGLTERHLRSVVIMPLGYRDAQEDWLVDLKKVRRARADFVTDIA